MTESDSINFLDDISDLETPSIYSCSIDFDFERNYNQIRSRMKRKFNQTSGTNSTTFARKFGQTSTFF
jgi:hypothetical protein